MQESARVARLEREEPQKLKGASHKGSNTLVESLAWQMGFLEEARCCWTGREEDEEISSIEDIHPPRMSQNSCRRYGTLVLEERRGPEASLRLSTRLHGGTRIEEIHVEQQAVNSLIHMSLGEGQSKRQVKFVKFLVPHE